MPWNEKAGGIASAGRIISKSEPPAAPLRLRISGAVAVQSGHWLFVTPIVGAPPYQP
jgi:hypothetical protein